MELDRIFSREFNVVQMLKKLKEWGFYSVDNKVENIRYDGKLYYKQIQCTDNFIIFEHYWETNSKFYQGFALFVASYKNKNDIGSIKGENIISIKAVFCLERDMKEGESVEDYIRRLSPKDNNIFPYFT